MVWPSSGRTTRSTRRIRIPWRSILASRKPIGFGYVRDSAGVEREAIDNAARFAAWLPRRGAGGSA